MKRLLLLAAASLALSSAAYAADSYVPFTSLTPKTAKSMGLGGVFSSVPTAEFSFFGNPADFADKKPTLILPTVDAWAYVRPSSSNISGLASAASNTSALMSKAFGLMAQNGGTGGGLSAGLGYAGRGLGLGAFVLSDEYIEGSSPASATVHSETQATAVIGLGLPLQLGGLRISVGGDLRPFYRVSLDPVELASLLKIMDAGGHLADQIDASAFFGMAMDLGASLQLDTLTVGLSIRDISPAFPLWNGSLTDLLASVSAGNLPKTSGSTTSATFAPNVTAGLSWAPKLLPGLVDPTLYCELQDPVSVFKGASGIGTALNLLHAGAEVKLLSFITLRGGLNRGWLSAGAGLKLLFVDLNAAVFTEELGALPGDNPRSGLALQAAIRF